MRSYDQWKATDETANDGDLRLDVCPECRSGEHEHCSDDDCACGCTNPEMPRDGEE